MYRDTGFSSFPSTSIGPTLVLASLNRCYHVDGSRKVVRSVTHSSSCLYTVLIQIEACLNSHPLASLLCEDERIDIAMVNFNNLQR